MLLRAFFMSQECARGRLLMLRARRAIFLLFTPCHHDASDRPILLPL